MLHSQVNLESGPIRISSIGHYIPPKHSGDGLQDPQLILLFGWFGASLLQLMKYSSTYSNAYPAAAQILIQSDLVSLVMGSKEPNRYRLRPILEKLAEMGVLSDTPPRLLLHVFSGGGAGQLISLALLLGSTAPNKTFHPVASSPTCLILDSAPGSFRHVGIQRGFVASLAGLTRLCGLAVASAFYVALTTGSIFSGQPRMHDFIRNNLNDPKFFPWMDRAVPRLYLYSDADQITASDYVRAHIAAAKKTGLTVREEVFLGSAHVQHSKVYPDRYWVAVRSIWGDAMRSKL
ncbi:hypothetical protein FB451DRAFT_707096 [Mycena latifolia]|nr:hypothetical protein FB451DRAFT_707096 [Mycena latifolia]